MYVKVQVIKASIVSKGKVVDYEGCPEGQAIMVC